MYPSLLLPVRRDLLPSPPRLVAEPMDRQSVPEQEPVSGPVDFVARHFATSPEFDPSPGRELQPVWLAPRGRMPVRHPARGPGLALPELRRQASVPDSS
ncbi:MAG TPA: hypothetical protein PKW90_10265 [Myxococcota bacterium]|nr:hypothetical protein [Myxococcota bacterium]